MFKVSFFWDKGTKETDTLFDRTLLPRGVRMTEESRDIEILVVNIFDAIIESERMNRERGRGKEFSESFDGVFETRDFESEEFTGFPFSDDDESLLRSRFGSAHGITFEVAETSTRIDDRRAYINRYAVWDELFAVGIERTFLSTIMVGAKIFAEIIAIRGKIEIFVERDCGDIEMKFDTETSGNLFR